MKGRSPRHACCAAWNRGLFGSRSLPDVAVIVMPKWSCEKPGSGKSLIACARMHLEKATISCCRCAC